MGQFLLDHLALVALFLGSGAVLVWPEIARFTGAGGASLGTLEATRLLNQNGTLVLDVREAEEFATGHLPRARNVPLKELEGRAAEFNRHKAKAVLVTCKSGARSATAVRTLKKAGFEQVYPLKGGVAAWQAASLPLEK